MNVQNDISQEVQQDFYNAIDSGDLAKVRAILEDQPRILHISTELGGFLHVAAEVGNLAVVDLFIKRGAQIDQEAEVGGSPVDLAAANGHLETVKHLVTNGASLRITRPDRNPLFSAINQGHSHVAQYLLEAGLDPHVVYRGGGGKLRNALSFAIERGQQKIVDLLLAAGCQLPVEGADHPVWEPAE